MLPELHQISPPNDERTDYDLAIEMAVRKTLELASIMQQISTMEHLEDEEALCYLEWSGWMRDWCDRMFPPKEDWGGDNIIRFPYELSSS